MNAADAASFRKHIRTYVGVFIALIVGTILTVLVSYVHFGSADSHAGNITVAMIVAVIKAFLVAGFFMHLVSERRSIYTVLACTAIFFAGLVGLTLWSMHDPPALTTPSALARPALPTSPATAHHVP